VAKLLPPHLLLAKPTPPHILRRLRIDIYFFFFFAIADRLYPLLLIIVQHSLTIAVLLRAILSETGAINGSGRGWSLCSFVLSSWPLPSLLCPRSLRYFMRPLGVGPSFRHAFLHRRWFFFPATVRLVQIPFFRPCRSLLPSVVVFI